MPIFRPARDESNVDEVLLLWKVRLFVVGAGLGVAGMMMELPVLLWAGVAALGIGLWLRLRQRRREEQDAADLWDEDGEPGTELD